jgi:hypothetical protein
MQEVFVKAYKSNGSAREIKKLRVGFDIITDVPEFKPASREVAKRMEHTRNLVKDQGLNRIIHIMETSAGHAPVAHGNKATSIATAEMMLDNAKHALA